MIRIDDVAAHCSVTGGAERSVAVAENDIQTLVGRVTFDVTCVKR